MAKKVTKKKVAPKKTVKKIGGGKLEGLDPVPTKTKAAKKTAKKVVKKAVKKLAKKAAKKVIKKSCEEKIVIT